MINSFHLIAKDREVNSKSFLMGLLIICLFYLLGEFPLVIAVNISGTEITEDYISLVSNYYGKTIALFLLLCPLIFVVFGFIIISKIFKWPFQLFISNRDKIDWNRYLFAFIIWFLICLIQFVCFKDENIVWNFSLQQFLPLVVIATVSLFFQTWAEELVFRSYSMKLVGVFFKSPLIPIVITGVLFGLMHGSNPEIDVLGSSAILLYIWSGLFLGTLTILDDGLELPAGYHFANNLFAALIVTTNWQVFSTDALYIDTNSPSIKMADFFLLIGFDMLFLIICNYKYRWNFKKLLKHY